MLALSDLSSPAAKEELRHAAKALEKALRAQGQPDAFDRRRKALAQRVLERM